MTSQRETCLERLEELFKNLDTGMTAERYFEMQDQMGLEIEVKEIPPELNDFPDDVLSAVDIYGRLGDRVYPEIGYLGKDYTLLSELMPLYEIDNKDFFLQVLEWLDARAIKQSADTLKREYDRMKRKH